MIEFILAYTLLLCFFLLEIFLRKGNTAKRIDKTEHDKRSTYLIGFTFFTVLFLSLIFNYLRIGVYHNETVAFIGLALMLIGITIRIYSMLTLQKYYTRTLILTEEHTLIQKGLYKFIRHPGYLGTILVWGACGLAMQNEIVCIIAIILLSIAYYHRITTEEKMLTEKFGNEYILYRKSSWRLFPFIW